MLSSNTAELDSNCCDRQQQPCDKCLPDQPQPLTAPQDSEFKALHDEITLADAGDCERGGGGGTDDARALRHSNPKPGNGFGDRLTVTPPLPSGSGSGNPLVSPTCFRPNTPSVWSDDEVRFAGRCFSRQQVERSLLLFFVEEQRPLAELIANHSRGRVVLGEIGWDRFNDGFPHLRVEHARAIRWADVAFLVSFHTPETIFEQISVIYALPRFLARSVKLVLPYFPTATMERADNPESIATAWSLAHMLSAIPLAAGGPVQICIFDIHSLANQFYFGDQVLVRLHSCICLLRRELRRREHSPATMAIAFPDAGAHKRFAEQFPEWSTVVCNKIRSGDDRCVRIQDGDPSGRHMLIVDDLVQSGGTLLECVDALYAAGATQVSAYVTHPVFPKQSWTKFLPENRPEGRRLANFWVMDTIPVTVKELQGKEPFRVLTCAPLVHHILIGD